MKTSDHQFEFIKDLILLLQFIIEVKKLKVTASWLGRDDAIQKILYDKGLSKTLESNHLTKTAIDLNIFLNKFVLTNKKKGLLTKKESDLLAEIGVFWENLNPLNRWGGFFKSFYDPGHFERNIN